MIKINSYLIRIRIKIREMLNPYLGPIRRRFLKNPHFTIISNNCWAGLVYRYFGLPYDSPTIGLYFFAEDYLKFVSNFEYYISKELEFINYEESKYKDLLVKRHQTNKPLGRLDDVEIVFLHYKDKEEAYAKWNRRRQRIHFDNLFFKFSEMNKCKLTQLQEFDNLPHAKKMMFVCKDYTLKSQIIVRTLNKKGRIDNDTDDFLKYFDIFSWLNENKLMQK